MQSIPNERDFLEYCYSLIENQCEWGVRENWKNSNFEELSFRIHQVSRIRISPGTLKRTFGKVKTKEGYQPQQATKDALAIYLGFKNWNYLKEQLKSELTVTEEQVFKEVNKTIRNQSKAKYLILAVFSFFLISVLIFVFIKSGKVAKNEKIDFSGKHLVGKAYHTAVFNYDVSKVDNNFYIDFGDGQKLLLDKRLTTISHYYMLPDLYKVLFYSENKTFEQDTSVYITTNGWEAFANEMKEEIRYYPVNKFSIIDESRLSITPEKVMLSGVDTNSIFWVHFCNMKPFELLGDNFTLETIIKNRPEVTQVRCNHIRIEIIGDYGRHTLYFVKPGCAKWVNLQFGEIRLDGVNNDFIEFGRDFSDWRTVELHVEDNNVKVYYENNMIYTISYKESIGNIMGIRYSFTGYGEVDKIILYNEAGDIEYLESFNN